MNVRKAMTPDVTVVPPTANLQEAARKMRDLDVGPMPVCDGDKIVGMLTDRDITIRATAEGFDPKVTEVSRVMTPAVIYCYEDDDTDDAAKIMERNQIRRLPVLNRDHRLVGIVSIGDLAVGVGDSKQTGKTIERISEPSEPKQKAA